ncbi:MAG TPA: ABC transporter ATP-binding protein [Ilumatobacteraceae bacterium]|nr:ABC transporter ATP-binding protein [Ilumatobacteraceae bacterium]
MPSAEPITDDAVAPDDDLGAIERARRNARFIAELVMVHPKLFIVAMVGAAVFALLTVASSVAIGRVIDDVILPSFESGGVSTATVVAGLAVVIGIGVLRAVAIVVRRSFASITMWRVAQTFTNRVVERYVAQPVSWHNRRADGDLVQRAGVDSEATVSVLAPIPFASGTLIMLVASTIWMLTIDVPVGLVAIVVFPLLLITNVVYEKSVSTHFTRAQDQLGEFSAGVHESFEGVQLVKSYGAEERETERLAGFADRVRASRVHAIKLRSWFEALLDVIPSLTNILLVVIGALRVRSGDVTVGEFSSVIFLFTLLVFPLRLIGYTLSELPRSMAAWKRIRVVLDEPIEPDPVARIGSAADGFGAEFAGVTFAHEGHGPPTVKAVDLAVRQGSVTALVGPTGSGKSTIAQLAAGLIGPGVGEVRLAPGARSIVFQEAFLSSGTVRDNVELGASYPDEEIWDALDQAAATEFVRRLPQQLDTVVGERGISLSGGQRQRLALARALVRQPSLLVLDDTTSALDPATEALILERLRSRLSGSTILMVASRPSTIALAGDVVFVAGGRIAAHGTHDELLESTSAYRELVEAFEADRDREVRPGPPVVETNAGTVGP